MPLRSNLRYFIVATNEGQVDVFRGVNLSKAFAEIVNCQSKRTTINIMKHSPIIYNINSNDSLDTTSNDNLDSVVKTKTNKFFFFAARLLKINAKFLNDYYTFDFY